MYDVNVRQTFERLPQWLAEMETFVNRSDVVKMLVGNKIDVGQRQVRTSVSSRAPLTPSPRCRCRAKTRSRSRARTTCSLSRRRRRRARACSAPSRSSCRRSAASRVFVHTDRWENVPDHSNARPVGVERTRRPPPDHRRSDQRPISVLLLNLFPKFSS